MHIALALAWLAGTALLLIQRRTEGPAEQVARAAAALLAATIPLYLQAGGWWVDMPGRFLVPGAAVIGIAALLGPRIAVGRLALLVLAGFYLALGTLAIRNSTPLPLPMAAKAVLLGAALLLAAASGRPGARIRQALTLALLLAAGAAAFLDELPVV
ncbi:MAG: hypothetical protein ACRC1J_03125 [Sandaracinobacteroides sp.]